MSGLHLARRQRADEDEDDASPGGVIEGTEHIRTIHDVVATPAGSCCRLSSCGVLSAGAESGRVAAAHRLHGRVLRQKGASLQVELLIKTPEQGAATTVWAAVGAEWEGRGGRFLEDCSVSEPFVDAGAKGVAPGYVPYAYDEGAARKLWELSLELVKPYLPAQ